ncbi:MAG: GreA/GreB family elongation factor [Patescibacteria group bacterium]|nr:GreA/GreB family elongation factor [Patescibacteria group bacterium]
MRILRHRDDKFKTPDTGPLYLTQAALDRMREKLERMKKALPAMIAETQRTAAFGDRSENAEYKEAKSTLRRTHRQILSTEFKIKRAVVISAQSGDTVQLGSTVTVEVNGHRRTYEILGSYETDPSRGRISNESPLGAALLGKKVGDTVIVKTKTGSQEYTVRSIGQ